MNRFFSKLPFIDQTLKGIGQIMLQENRWTGLLFIIGLFIGSWQYAAAAILAAAAGTAAAKLLKYNQQEIDAGLYGFSPALVGVVLVFLFDDILIIWFLVIAGGILAATIQHFFITKKIPAYTFPFILVAWAFIFLIRQYTEIPPSELLQIKFEPTQLDVFLAPTNGFGEVIFQASVLSGVIFFIAVFINSPVAALYGLAASLLGAVLSVVNGQPLEQINLGLFGFNAVLTAIVFAGTKKIDGLWVLSGVIITIVIHNLLIDHHILDVVGGVLTFPFVAGTWITLLIQKILVKKV
ncbi:MAG: urea transporter [Ignavibacteriota bacterium]|nr:urea transporter [Ignavibacteriota bacterium]MCO6449114.1 urea transporter [Ignavibacterium album]QKJ98101.1 MAG: urea transporter [Ignavibacteriota bacterium]HOJ06753.1 urea transporter [Ignavibacteriaceae bacterium]